MAESLYDPGTKIRLHGRFKVGAVLTDPTTIDLKVKDPAGVITTYSYPAGITKASTGSFEKDLVVSTPGNWYYKYIGTGAVAVSREKSFRIRVPVIP